MSRIHFFTGIFLQFLAAISMAAIPQNQQKKLDPKILVAPAAVIGGVAGNGFSLLNIKKEFNAIAKTERLIIDIGNIYGKPNIGMPSYYHAQFMKDPARLVIDFSQMPVSLMSEKQLQEALKSSHFVRRVKMTMDPEDKTVSMILDLRPTTKLKIMQVRGVKTTSKVVVDFL